MEWSEIPVRLFQAPGAEQALAHLFTVGGERGC